MCGHGIIVNLQGTLEGTLTMQEAKVIKASSKQVTLQVTIELNSDTFYETEEKILDGCNALGRKATELALQSYDADGRPIEVGGRKLTSRTRSNKSYQTPFGSIDVTRHVYQSSKGGRIYCPLDEKARIIHRSTPRFAKMLSNKYARMNAQESCADMLENHGRKVTLSFLQNVADAVGSIAQASFESWSYNVPEDIEGVSLIGMSLDGAMLLTREDGYRETMVASISLYDGDGERLHSIYFGASPEYGKESFKSRFDTEAKRVKERYPDAICLGIADGAKDNWPLLERYTDYQLIDFYHATEYLAQASYAAFPQKTGKPDRKKWMDEYCHILKHEPDGVDIVLTELKRVKRKHNLSEEVKKNVISGITYFTNNRPRMNYSDHVKQSWPIGSGVTEAACKTLIKQRFGRSGMRWKDAGIKTVLSLRELVLTRGRWNQFWEKILSKGTLADNKR